MKTKFYTIILFAIIVAAGTTFTSCKKCQTCKLTCTNISTGSTSTNDYGNAECDREGRAETKTNCEKAAQDGTTASYTCKCECETN